MMMCTETERTPDALTELRKMRTAYGRALWRHARSETELQRDALPVILLAIKEIRRLRKIEREYRKAIGPIYETEITEVADLIYKIQMRQNHGIWEQRHIWYRTFDGKHTQHVDDWIKSPGGPNAHFKEVKDDTRV